MLLFNQIQISGQLSSECQSIGAKKATPFLSGAIGNIGGEFVKQPIEKEIPVRASVHSAVEAKPLSDLGMGVNQDYGHQDVLHNRISWTVLNFPPGEGDRIV